MYYYCKSNAPKFLEMLFTRIFKMFRECEFVGE
jgi:hypothetical protein